jgi:hypothetical protein
MLVRILSVIFFVTAGSVSQGASVFWSFQTTATGSTYSGPTTALPSGGTFTSNLGFGGTPVLTAIAGTGSTGFGSAVVGTGGAGGTTFTDPATGTVWEGGGTAAPGNALQWGSDSTRDLTGSGFSLSLNTSGLTDLRLDFDVRSAQSGGPTGAPTGFSAINYRTDGGAWLSVGVVSSPTWLVQTGWQENISTLDLSSFDFLENQSTLELQLIFNGGTKSNSSSIHNMRIDNLLVTAVPEPSSFALLGLGVVALVAKRRR